jgi:hypothetical protein
MFDMATKWLETGDWKPLISMLTRQMAAEGKRSPVSA